MIIIYKIKNQNKIQLFGENFIKNNKNNCKIIVENKEQDISEYLNVNKNITNVKIKLKEIKTISNMSYMFYGCESLISLPDISNWNTNNVNNMSYMFSNCKSLTSLPDISNWNTSNVTNMSSIFFYSYSLISLPHVSNWNTSNVINMSHMFYNCNSLSLKYKIIVH